ncbi:MAG: Protein FecR [Kerstersia gyiorum]
MTAVAGRIASPLPTPQALQQAAEWFAILGAADVSDQQREAWQAWVNAHPSHRASWQRVEKIAGKFSDLPAPATDKAAVRDVLEYTANQGMQRRKSLGLLAVCLGVGAFGVWSTARLAPWQSMLATYATATGERRQYQLADGSDIWLNTQTAVDVEYDAALRRIVLLRGEILINTHPDTASPARAFIVDTPYGRLQALGTRFAVRLHDHHVQLMVFESAVRVTLPRSAGMLTVQAGQGVSFTSTHISAPEPARLSAQSWAQGVLLAEDMRLENFLVELSRYRRGLPIGCSAEVAGLRIVGAYHLDDVDAVLALLQDTLPVSVQRPLPGWIRVVASR